MHLTTDQCVVSFQSRLGKTPWIKPYTDHLLTEFIQKGIRNIAIACPSFVSDCLETLEEIGIRAKEQWIEMGGKELVLVPCLNTNSQWINGLVNLIHHPIDE